MAKPIFIISFPVSAEISAINNISRILSNQLDDYHVIVYKTSEVKDLSFAVLNAIDADPIQIEELMKKTQETINSLLNEKNNTETHE